jgi:hypothetical protein
MAAGLLITQPSLVYLGQTPVQGLNSGVGQQVEVVVQVGLLYGDIPAHFLHDYFLIILTVPTLYNIDSMTVLHPKTLTL